MRKVKNCGRSRGSVPQGRMTVGLCNSYVPVKFAEAHRRALARAGPIALAFDANLATFGFPYDKDLRTPLEIVRWISGTTSIGESGKYLVELAEAGRFQTFDFPKKGFPPQLGDIVVTTNRPDSQRAAGAKLLAGLLRRGRPKFLFVCFGAPGPGHPAVFPPWGYYFALPRGGRWPQDPAAL